MALVVPNEAEITLLQYLVNMVAPDDPVLRLYTNNLVPDETTTLGMFTEATGATGYTAITLTGSSWTTTSVGGTTTALYSEQTFTFSTNANIYGYYVTSSSGALLWCETFSGSPFVLPDGGGTIAISARIQLS
jgi:hypothetical protein